MSELLGDIFISKLRFHAYHGVLVQEQTVGNDYQVDLSMKTDISKAVESDNIGDTVNYGEVCEIVKQEMAIHSDLMEHLAGRIARGILQQFPCIRELIIKITKLNPPLMADCEGAGVMIHLINDKT